MTLAELSVRTDIDDTYLGRVERNEINITLNTLEKIIAGLSMTSSEFFSFLEVEERSPEIFKIIQGIQESKEKEKILELIRGILDLYQS
ncbi:hypothetical protein IGI50_000300 [Enterococcus sp. DIV0170]